MYVLSFQIAYLAQVIVVFTSYFAFSFQISDNAKNIKHLHAKILYQANPDPTHQERLDDLAAENLRLGAQVGKALSAEHDKLDTAIQAASGGAKSQKLGVEMRMRKVQLSTNTQRFKEVIGKFHAEMDEFK